MTEHKQVVYDFVLRTQKNLKVIENLHDTHSKWEVYEVTQLINSMLGFILFPREEIYNLIPEMPIDELIQSGWLTPNKPYPCNNLRELVRFLRNSIAHHHIEFQVDDNTRDILGITFWNNNQRGVRTGVGQFSIDELKIFIQHFLDLILELTMPGQNKT